jgi:acyl-CoA synthetase (NDP forming)
VLDAGGPVLTERESKQVLAAIGVPVTREQLAADAGQALEAARSMGYPLALKVESPGIAHKTEAGVIRLGLADGEALRRACREVLDAAARNAPGAKINGLLVQEMAPQGLEIAVGVTMDEQFGPMITVGLGGIFIEVMADTRTLPAPVDQAAALRMLESLRGARLLRGFRGMPPVDVQALAGIVARVSELAARFAGVIEQIDINPLIARGKAIVAVDALIVKRAA